MNIEHIDIEQIVPYDKNPRKNDESAKVVAESIRQFGFKVPVVIDANNVIVCGHTRIKALKRLLDEGVAVPDIAEGVPCVRADDLSDEQIKAFRLADNKTIEASEWDFDLLNDELAELADFGMDKFGFDDIGAGMGESGDIAMGDPSMKGNLAKRFVVPPFSVLHTYKGEWQQRKRMWDELIGCNGESRENVLADEGSMMAQINQGVSLFNPVLAEICCKWFCPTCGKIFDTFAGDTLKGLVFSYCGHDFTGIELRKEQVEENEKRIAECEKLKGAIEYICDDGQNVLKHFDEKSQDMFFSCPPYYDLEVYSDKPNDASNQATYGEFIKILEKSFTDAVKCLKDDRFAVIVVGDVRGKDGAYYDFPGDIKRIFKNAGMCLYNDIILCDAIGSAMLRASNSMKNRKVVKIHQNVIVFYKGDIKRIKDNFDEIEYTSEEVANMTADFNPETKEVENV